MRWFARRRKKVQEIAPDEIFLDSSNLPGHNEKQFEGRVPRPVAGSAIFGVGVVFVLIALAFGLRAFNLEVTHGAEYADTSRNNRLDRSIVFATRGIIYDRAGRKLAWNEARPHAAGGQTVPQSADAANTVASPTFALRRYIESPGLAHIIGFVRYPKADLSGTWWREEYAGISGVELAYDSVLSGQNGSTIVETNARGQVMRENIIALPKSGSDVKLSIDAEVESKLYALLSAHARKQNFNGGAAVIMNVRTGELLALTSFPEYDNSAFTEGRLSVIQDAFDDPRTPLLNRAVAGTYTPGSIVKPIFAVASLNEGIISPDKEILSTGAITIPNPYDPSRPSVFRDWAVHGLVDMRTAIAVSSDEYFYTIGGGYGSQPGLGVARLDEYARRFGLGTTTGIALRGEASGVIPTPAWKEQVFGPNDPWRIGDTYHTVIGQYGFQISPIQAVRFIAAVANGGKLLKPQIIADSPAEYTETGIPDSHLEIAREGMRLAVVSTRTDATAKSLNINGISIAAKTGTAQVGLRNESMNSWSVGFWPFDNPLYAYATVLEKAPAGTLSGAAPAMLPFFQWLAQNKPEYLK